MTKIWHSNYAPHLLTTVPQDIRATSTVYRVGNQALKCHVHTIPLHLVYPKPRHQVIILSSILTILLLLRPYNNPLPSVVSGSGLTSRMAITILVTYPSQRCVGMTHLCSTLPFPIEQSKSNNILLDVGVTLSAWWSRALTHAT